MVLDDGTQKYVWGNGLAYSVNKTRGAAAVYHMDGLGSVRALSGDTGSVTQTYQTDEFGVPTLIQGPSAQPFGFTGEQRDAEDGLIYLRARVYDPSTGRFSQRDQFPGWIGDPSSLNRYAYVRDDPINLSDPLGLSASQPAVLRDRGSAASGHNPFAPDVLTSRAVDVATSLADSVIKPQYYVQDVAALIRFGGFAYYARTISSGVANPGQLAVIAFLDSPPTPLLLSGLTQLGTDFLFHPGLNNQQRFGRTAAAALLAIPLVVGVAVLAPETTVGVVVATVAGGAIMDFLKDTYVFPALNLAESP